MVASASGHGSLIGATLGGYEVVALIGRGAMGSVYLARDMKLNRMVALKVLLGSLARTPSLVKQFHQEAQNSAPLNHPGIVRIYSAGIEDGTPYIAMEYVEGLNLDDYVRQEQPDDDPVACKSPQTDAQQLDEDVALQEPHAARVIGSEFLPACQKQDQAHEGIRRDQDREEEPVKMKQVEFFHGPTRSPFLGSRRFPVTRPPTRDDASRA